MLKKYTNSQEGKCNMMRKGKRSKGRKKKGDKKEKGRRKGEGERKGNGKEREGVVQQFPPN